MLNYNRISEICLFGDCNTVEKSGKSGYECSQKTREIVKKKHSVIVPTIGHVYNNIVG
jgi:hypothetical protein